MVDGTRQKHALAWLRSGIISFSLILLTLAINAVISDRNLALRHLAAIELATESTQTPVASNKLGKKSSKVSVDSEIDNIVEKYAEHEDTDAAFDVSPSKISTVEPVRLFLV